MTGKDLLVRLRNDVAELERVALLIERFGGECALDEATVFEINLALDEVLTNVISYAYEDGRLHEIEVHVAIENGEVRVEVRDDGRPFDPLCVAPVDLSRPVDDRPIGGLGLHLVRRVMDGLEYRREADGNVLTMRKRAAGTS
jgi:anti-sigma regulatory factor (Ser/Thr protein kinase)